MDVSETHQNIIVSVSIVGEQQHRVQLIRFKLESYLEIVSAAERLWFQSEKT